MFLIVFASPGSAATAPPVRKACGTGITLQVNAASAVQGSVLLVRVRGKSALPEMKSEWDGKAVPLWHEGGDATTLHGILGIDLELHPSPYEWKVTWTGGDGAAQSCSVSLVVRAGKFATENLKVENQFVQPNPEQQKRAEEDQKKMRAIYDTVTPEVLWTGKFRLPLKDVTSGGNFGRRRVLNGQPRSPHTGVDFPALAGTPVYASQSGMVVLAEELYYAGNTVVIDHGYGVYTMYAHLSAIEAHAGDKVAAGAEVGKVGATGRVTGPHLHWGLTIQHARVNGMNIVEREP
ncbi:MAG TPA: M23 family metallopeptidase [Candidatus Saccharimonadales bacterium]|nr:M23 family metallopeptidase [Candidatus Saccharimonadales bacterium]